nr:YbaK/EbsC family protein [uncultured Brachyspira sp.]
MMNEKVLNALKKLNIEYKEFEEAGATKTVDDAAKTLNIERGQVAKSILVKPSKKNFAMIIASGDKKISSKKMRAYFECKTSFANAEDTFNLTGFTFGGVCPFGVENIDILVDKSMKRFDDLYIACGSDSSLAKMSYDEILKKISNVEVDLTED